MINTLKIERARHNMSMEELANIMGVTRQTIHLIENKKQSPTLELAMKICWYFQKNMDELFRMDEEEKKTWPLGERRGDWDQS